MAGIRGGGSPVEKILQMAADAMHGDTRLEPRNPDHNNYVIDSVMSWYWHQKGMPDNALTKAKEALLDVDNTHFPSETEKNVVLAGIHELMANIYSDHGRLAEMIEAEKAAVDLGVPTVHAQLICLGNYGLK